MPESHRLLVLDQGSQSSRALLFDETLQVIAEARRPVRTLRPAPGRVEQDPPELLRSLQECMAELLARDRQPPSAVGLATQRSTVVAWDRQTGRPLSPALSWQDTRMAGDARLEQLDPVAVRESTGLFPGPHYGASKMAWCLEHLPAVARAAERGRLALGPLASYLVAGLVPGSAPCVDPCNGARSLLMDLATGDWNRSLIDAFGLQLDWLPRTVPNLHDFGACEDAPGAPMLRALTGDQNAIPLGNGPLHERRCWLQLGTGAFVLRLRPPGAADPPRLLRTLLLSDGQGQLEANEGTINGAGAALEEFLSAGEQLEDALHATPTRRPGGGGRLPIFLNGIGGLGSPDWLPRFESCFHGPGDRGDRLAAIVESIGFLVQRNLSCLGPGITELVVGGGLSRLDELCQLLADLSGLTVLRPSDHEATARGVAAALLHGLEGAELEAAKRFDPRENEPLAERHARWCELMPSIPSGSR